MKKREIGLVGKKFTFAEAEERELDQWLTLSFNDKWLSLERMRRKFYALHQLPFSNKVERVINKVKRWS